MKVKTLNLNRRVVSFTVFIFLVFSFIYMWAGKTVTAEDLKIPPAPQLVTDAWMLIIGFEADPAVIKELLPSGLEPNPSNMVVINMYTVPEASQTSGFGAYTLTYITVQLKDQDSYIMGSSTGEPGRYFTYYWNSSELMRAFTREVGIPAETGSTQHVKENGKLVSTLTVDGVPFIEATAQVSDELQPTVGGHLNYFGLKKTPKSDGSGELTQIIKFPIPFVVRTVKTENATVTFKMPKEHPAYRLKPINVKWASYMKGSFVYPQAVVIKEWSSDLSRETNQ